MQYYTDTESSQTEPRERHYFNRKKKNRKTELAAFLFLENPNQKLKFSSKDLEARADKFTSNLGSVKHLIRSRVLPSMHYLQCLNPLPPTMTWNFKPFYDWDFLQNYFS